MKNRHVKKVSAGVRRRCRVFPPGNPRNVLTAIVMLLLVISSHVVFYQSTVVDLPRRESNSTTLPPGNISRRQSGVRWTLFTQRTSTERVTASTTPTNSLNSTALEQRQPETDMKRVRLESRIVIRGDNAVRTAASKRPKEITMAAEADDTAYRTETEPPSTSESRDGSRDRSGSAPWTTNQSRLLTAADSQRFLPISPRNASFKGLVSVVQ